MNKTTNKKLTSLLLSLVLICSSFAIGVFSSYGSDLVAINATNFPDTAFRYCISSAFDTNGDGYLSQAEINAETSIKISGLLESCYGEDTNQKITDLTGIEYFTNCKTLHCGGIGLTSLDVSALTNLTTLMCHGNELTELDVSKNTNLQALYCSSNELTTLDVSKNTKLTRLDCYINNLSELDLSKNTNLQTLNCQQNELTELDLSKNTALKTLKCSHNHLLTLDLTANTNLKEVTDASIGSQTTTAQARMEGDIIYVELAIPNYENIASTSVDRTEDVDGIDTLILGYDGDDFTPESIDQIVNGIDYYYSTGLDDTENMSVHIDVLREFWQVKFYTDESKTELMDTQVILTGGNATAPEITDIPQCKKFNGWSEKLTNITEDKEIYINWLNDHNIELLSFENDVVTFNCTKCQNQEEKYNFTPLVNITNSSRRFAPRLDVNGDGIINAKDYAMLKKMLK
jgi:hypothetical protein